MNVKLIPIAIATALLFAGCQESQSDTAKDVAEARTEARKDSNEARQDASESAQEANKDVAQAGQTYGEKTDAARANLTEAEADAMRVNARSAYDIAVTDADGRHEIAKQKCDALTGTDKDACVSAADAALAADKANAEANRDATLASADRTN